MSRLCLDQIKIKLGKRHLWLLRNALNQTQYASFCGYDGRFSFIFLTNDRSTNELRTRTSDLSLLRKRESIVVQAKTPGPRLPVPRNFAFRARFRGDDH